MFPVYVLFPERIRMAFELAAALINPYPFPLSPIDPEMIKASVVTEAPIFEVSVLEPPTNVTGPENVRDFSLVRLGNVVSEFTDIELLIDIEEVVQARI